MEESHNMHYERDSLSNEKSKRRLKTPAQVQALEKFYNEHKYPSESMKLQFADKVGLSEKQVSGWFCHRRSKDKKLLQDEGYANMKPNLSTGAIHDSASGLRQESCNSTKQVDRPFDGKEVESNRLHGKKISAAIPEQRGQLAHVESYGVADDRSSGSSTTSYEKLLKHGVDSCTVKPSYSVWDENCMRTDTQGVKKREHVTDTRYSYLQGYVESPAVSLIKLKLGTQYCEDGPLLATDFDPLPPGAFDSPVRDLNTEPFYVGDSIHPRSCSVHVIVGEPKMHDKYRRETIPNDSHLEGSGYDRKLQRFNHHGNFSGCQLTPNASYSKNNGYGTKRTFVTEEEGKDFAGEASDDYRSNNLRSFKHRSREISDNCISDSVRQNCQKANANNPVPHAVPDCIYSTPMSQRELFRDQFPKQTAMSRQNGYPNTVDSVQPRGTLKVLKKKIHKQNRILENCNSVWPEMLLTNDSEMMKKAGGKAFRSKVLD